MYMYIHKKYIKKIGWLSKLLHKLNKFEILTRIFSFYGHGTSIQFGSFSTCAYMYEEHYVNVHFKEV